MNKLKACAADGVDVGDAPEEIKLLPLGLVHSQKGDFLVDDESCRMILKQFRERRLDIVIDYEHQTLEGVQAPAAGWVKDLRKGEDALIAKVEWTPKAEEYLKNKEYKYLSPVVLKREQDMRVTAIHSTALTNTPAIDGMFAIVNSLNIEDYNDGSDGGMIMELEKLIKLLGLQEGATEEDVLKAIEAAAKSADQLKELSDKGEAEKPDSSEVVANSTILSLLGLDKSAKTEDVTASIMALKSSGSDAQVLALKKRLDQKEADEVVKGALETGKITAAQTEWAKEYALKDPTGFKAFVDKAPVAVPLGKTQTVESKKETKTEVDPMVLKNLGMSEEDIKKYALKEDI